MVQSKYQSVLSLWDFYSVIKKPSVAVLLTAYNGMAWIKEQIDSILGQKNVEVEIYISVDLSIDKTQKWCEVYSKQNANIKLLPYGEYYGGASKNFFRLIRDVDFSLYNYVALADQDDIWLPNKLAHAIDTASKTKLQAISSDVIAFFHDGREKLIKKSHPQQKFDYFFESAGPGCTYVFQCEALSQFKNFLQENWQKANEVNYHDWLIYAYFRKHHLTWGIDNQPLMRYRRHEHNQIGPNYGFNAYMKRLSMVHSRWYAKEVSKIFHLVDPLGETGLKLNRWFLVTHYRQLRRHPKESLVLLFLLLSGLY